MALSSFGECLMPSLRAAVALEVSVITYQTVCPRAVAPVQR